MTRTPLDLDSRTRIITFRMSANEIARVRALAKAEDRPLGSQLRKLVKAGLDQHDLAEPRRIAK